MATRPSDRWSLGRNPTVVAGVLLLVSGIIMLALAVGLPQTDSTSSLLRRSFSFAIQVAQRAILWGDRTLDDTQQNFNSIVVSVVVEGMTEEQRGALRTASSVTGGILSDLFSPLGILTTIGLIGGYFVIARTIDERYPAARNATGEPAPTEGESSVTTGEPPTPPPSAG